MVRLLCYVTGGTSIGGAPPHDGTTDDSGSAYVFRTTSEPYPGDITGSEIGSPPDGIVDVNDLLLLLGQWDTAGPEGDITGPGIGSPPDGIVDVNDLLLLLGLWGPCP